MATSDPFQYPDTLPSPATVNLRPADRLRRGEVPGPNSQHARERDFRAADDITFVFSPTQAAIFDAWWRGLRNGGASFVARWPVPAGWREATIRTFTSTPTWERLSGGNFRVSVSTEILGRSILQELASDYVDFDGIHELVHVVLPVNFEP